MSLAQDDSQSFGRGSDQGSDPVVLAGRDEQDDFQGVGQGQQAANQAIAVTMIGG